MRLAGPDACPDGRCPGALWGLWPEASLQASVVWMSAESPGPESPALAGWSGSPGDGAPLRWTPCVLPCPPSISAPAVASPCLHLGVGPAQRSCLQGNSHFLPHLLSPGPP